MSKKYTVWVGGVEVNDYYLTLENATRLSNEWKDDGHDDVTIQEVDDDE
mgnify:FL=1